MFSFCRLQRWRLHGTVFHYQCKEKGTMAILQTHDIQLYYETIGDGIPLLLIAGLGSDTQSWQTLAHFLSPHCRLIMPDNRGVSRTNPLNAECSIQKMADDCAALLRHLGVKSANVLGHSMGGMVAQDIAIRYPELVDKLILEGSVSKNSPRNNSLFADWAVSFAAGMNRELWFRNIFYWIFCARFFESEEAVRTAVRFSVDYPYPIDPVAFGNQVKAIAAFNSTELLSRIKAKTLVIAGKEDLIFSPDECARLAQAIPGAVFSVMDGAAHSIHMEQPRKFADCVLDFLQVLR